MPVFNPKPQNKVTNVLPNNQSVINTKPKNQELSLVQNYTYMETRTILKGSPMGLLLALTYPADITFTAPRI